MRQFLIVLITILVFSINAFAEKDSFQVVNIMEDFGKFLKKAEQTDSSTQVKLFRELVIEPNKEIFAAFTGQQSDEELAKYIKAVLPKALQLEKITEKIQKDLPEQITKFKETFPDLNWKGTVVFMPNYGITDSGTGQINNKPYLIFGVDTILFSYGEKAELTVLFSHELFHLYQSQFQPKGKPKNRQKGEVPLYELVWGEGLATYASKCLNPGISSEGIFLGSTLEKDASPILAKLAKEILKNFDSGDTKVWQPFMAGAEGISEIPGRSGYYVGYKVAEKLAKQASLKKLAQLKGQDLRKKMKKTLIELSRSK